MTDVLNRYCIKVNPVIEKFQMDYMLGILPHLMHAHAFKFDGNNHVTIYLDKIQCSMKFNSEHEIVKDPSKFIVYHPLYFSYLYCYYYNSVHLEKITNALRRM